MITARLLNCAGRIVLLGASVATITEVIAHYWL